MIRSKQIAFALVLVLAFAAGCVSTPVSAPKEGQIVVSASPSTIVLDEFGTPPVTTGISLITAQIFDANGIPQGGVEVVFGTDAGSLTSAPPGQPATALETDDNGLVSDTLTVQLGDPSPIDVTLRSGTLTGSVAVVKQEIGPNQPPVAQIDITPPNSAALNEPVLFDGSFSDDPDDDPITCYQWQIETGVNIAVPMLPCTPPNLRCEIQQGATASIISRVYSVEQILVATLRVTDDPAVACPPGPGGPAEPQASFNAIAATAYEIVCDATPPIARAGNDQNVALNGGASIVVPLSGLGSEDPETGIQNYLWNCGNGTPTVFGASVSCTYTAAAAYTATLTVTNGCGQNDIDDVRIFVGP